MTIKKKQNIKLWFVMIIALIFWSIGTGFNHDLSASSDETYKGLKLFSNVIELVEKNYVDEVDTKELIQKAVQGMVSSLDPHSALLPPEAFEELQIGTHGEFGGIGIVITMQKGVLTVISPIEGTPAYKAGIKAGDKIIKVDGELTMDMMLWEAVRKMRGPKGKSVVITIIRKGVLKPIDFKLIRDIIPVLSVKSLVLQPGYGYIWITNFQDNTTDELKLALEKLESGSVPLKGLVLDLRDNPGGLLNQSILVTDLFLEKGKIVSIKGRLKKHTKIFRAHPNKIKRDYPIVVLINGGSASASEIVSSLKPPSSIKRFKRTRGLSSSPTSTKSTRRRKTAAISSVIFSSKSVRFIKSSRTDASTNSAKSLAIDTGKDARTAIGFCHSGSPRAISTIL